MNQHEIIHDINGYFQNISSLLRFIKEDALIENSETSQMLNMVISREPEITKTLENLRQYLKDQNA